MRTKIISTLILLLLLPCILHAQGNKKIKEQKLTAAEIKEAERIFATFKKRLEETNDLRIALRGRINSNWIFDKKAIPALEDHGIRVKNRKLLISNRNLFKSLFVSTLNFGHSSELFGNIMNALDGKYNDLSSVFSQLPLAEQKILNAYWETDFVYDSRLQVIQIIKTLTLVTKILNKEIANLKIKQPKFYYEGLNLLNRYSGSPEVSTCDNDCLGLPKGTEIVSAVQGYFVIYVGKVKNQMKIMMIIVYRP